MDSVVHINTSDSGTTPLEAAYKRKAFVSVLDPESVPGAADPSWSIDVVDILRAASVARARAMARCTSTGFGSCCRV